MVKARTYLISVTGTCKAGRLMFINTVTLPGELEMDSDDCAFAVAINDNNSYKAKA